MSRTSIRTNWAKEKHETLMKPEGERGVKKLLKTKAVRCMYCML